MAGYDTPAGTGPAGTAGPGTPAGTPAPAGPAAPAGPGRPGPSPRAGRRGWLVAGSVVAGAAVVFATWSLLNMVAREIVTERSTFGAAGLTGLDIDGLHGRVEVVGASVDEVTVEARITHGLRRTGHDVRVEDGVLRLTTDCPPGPPLWCNIDYRVSVPSGLAVEATTRNGSVALRDLDGPVTARTSNGAVRVARMGGDLDIRTSNGSIEARALTSATVTARTSNGAVELTFAAAPTIVDARTSNGSVEVVVPDGPTTYRLDMQTSFVGSTDTAVRTDPASPRSITARTSNGSITVRYPTG
ncbi:MAG: DUF4097 family beta strand repeat-containing protein [Actinomycetota bacterium]